MEDTPRADDKRHNRAADHPSWDRKQGKPKDREAEGTVERASSRYSASEQSEDKKKKQERG